MLEKRLILLFVVATSAHSLAQTEPNILARPAAVTTTSSGAAYDPTAVHLAGTETITGSKTFTNNSTFSDPTKTLLLGASAVPDISGTRTPGGGQFLISSRSADAKVPFAVVGDFRPSSADRYETIIYPDAHLFTNAYINIFGGIPPTVPESASMLSIQPDVPVSVMLFAGAPDSSGGRLITGYGIPDSSGTVKHVFEVNTEGTVTITNPYGEFGPINWPHPQLVVRDTSTKNNTPSDACWYLFNGVTYIGTYNNSTNSVESQELQISSGAVVINGSLRINTLTRNGFMKTSGGNGTFVVDTTNYVPTTTTVNGHPLSGNVTLTAADLGLQIGTNVESSSPNLDTGSGKTPYAGTLTITPGKTVNATKSLTFSGTDGTTVTFPSKSVAIGSGQTDIIDDQTFSSAAASYTVIIPAGYTHLRVVSLVKSASRSLDSLLIQPNSDSTAAHYRRQYMETGTAGMQIASLEPGIFGSRADSTGGGSDAAEFASGDCNIYFVSNATAVTKSYSTICNFVFDGIEGCAMTSTTGYWKPTSPAAINSLTFVTVSGRNIAAGSRIITYGIR
jgi:hypothetical protein